MSIYSKCRVRVELEIELGGDCWNDTEQLARIKRDAMEKASTRVSNLLHGPHGKGVVIAKVTCLDVSFTWDTKDES